MDNFKIVTTPMCEKILQIVGIKDYIVNKNPDKENADFAVALSETKFKMNGLNLKLNTFSQIKESIFLMAKYSPNKTISEEEIDNIFKEYKVPLKWLKSSKKNNIKVKVYSKFLKEIAEDLRFEIVEDNQYFTIFPDYLEDIVEEKNNLVKIPSHSNISNDPIERAILRYSILDNLII